MRNTNHLLSFYGESSEDYVLRKSGNKKLYIGAALERIRSP
jgi:hypothetical protein